MSTSSSGRVATVAVSVALRVVASLKLLKLTSLLTCQELLTTLNRS